MSEQQIKNESNEVENNYDEYNDDEYYELDETIFGLFLIFTIIWAESNR